MADRVVTISEPVLGAGEYFAVQYRKLPNGNWVNLGNLDNDPFNILGLDDSTLYELSVTLYKSSPLRACKTKYYRFQTPEPLPECECPDNFGVQLQFDQTGTMVEARFSCDTPEPYNNGYSIEMYEHPSGNVVMQTNTHQLDGFFVMFSGYARPYGVRLFINCDELYGTMIECETVANLTPQPPPCVPIDNINGSLQNIGGIWYIVVNFTQSSPVTNPIAFSYIQTDIVMAGFPDGGALNASPSSGQLLVPVFPNINTGTEQYHYDIVMHDVCGNVHTLSVSN